VADPSSKVNCIFLSATDHAFVCARLVHSRRRLAPPNFTITRPTVREVRLIHDEYEQRSAGNEGGAIAGLIIGAVGGIAAGPPRAVRVMITAPVLAGLGAAVEG
jgi:hypothetical protein